MPKSVETIRPQKVIDQLRKNGVESTKLYQVSDELLVEKSAELVRSLGMESSISEIAQKGVVEVDQVINNIKRAQKTLSAQIDEISQTLTESQRQEFALTIERWLAAKRWSLGGLKGALVARHVIQTDMVSDAGEVELSDALRTQYALPVGEKIQLSRKSRLRRQVQRTQTQRILKTDEALAAADYLLNPPEEENQLTNSNDGVVTVGADGPVELEVGVGQTMEVGANGNGYRAQSMSTTSIIFENLPPEPSVDPHIADTQPTRVRPAIVEPEVPSEVAPIDEIVLPGSGSEVLVVGATADSTLVEVPVDEEPQVEASSEPEDETPNAVVSAAELPVVESVTSGTVLGEQFEPSEEEIIAQRQRQYEQDLDRIIYRHGIKEGFREIGRLLLGVISKKWQRSYVESLRMRLFKMLVLEELQKRNRKHMRTDWEKEYVASKRRLKTFEYDGLVAYVELLIDSNMFALVPKDEHIAFEYSGVKRNRN